MAMRSLCSAPDCRKTATSKGFCGMHYSRLVRGGTLSRRRPKLSLHDLLEGQTRFGSWTVIGEAPGVPRPGNGIIRYAHVRCECGAERAVTVNSLKRGTSRHCGCKVSELVSEMKSTHRACRTPEYKAWTKAKERCTNPNSPDWPNYGGRGICMAAEWLNDPAAFLAYMGPKPTPKHSIDRIDVNGHYEPGNVRWADLGTQARNRRNNRMVSYRGQIMTVAEACETAGAARSKVYERLRRGLTIEQALNLD